MRPAAKPLLIRRFSSKQNIPVFIFILLSILLSYFVFAEVQSTLADDLRLFLSFITLIVIFMTIKAEVEPIEYSIVLMILTAIALPLGNIKIANIFATYGYLLVIVSIVIYFYKSRKVLQQSQK